MKEYDVIVIGSGAGAIIADEALAAGLSVALIDRGPLGGTCLNVGCIPSKILIAPADRVVEIQEAVKLGVHADIKSIDFSGIMKRMREVVQTNQDHIRLGLEFAKKLDFYEELGTFLDARTLKVGKKKIQGKKIFVVSGARPSIPPIQGLDEIEFLTNENVLALTEKPDSLLIVGGGYIAVEYAHFFSALGTRVILLQRGPRLVKEEEPEISSLLEKKLGQRMSIFSRMEVIEVKSKQGSIAAFAKNPKTGEVKEFTAERVLVAAGRKSNADLLQVQNAGIQTDKKGYIRVNEYFETTQKNIWALGDAIGRKMFRHSANRSAEIVWHNSQHEEKGKMDFNAVPHAVFSYPPIASVGLSESQAGKAGPILVGKAFYREVAKGDALLEDESFAKIILEKETGRILGFHIIGPGASILIQEVVNAMASATTVMPLVRGVHIHPALSEIIQAALGNLRDPKTPKKAGSDST